MATKKKVEAKERAAVSKERKLALALLALLDGIEGAGQEGTEGQMTAAQEEARALLKEMGYEGVESTAKKITRLTTELDAALKAQEYMKVAELGRELEKAKSGKFHRVSADAQSSES